MISKLQVSKLTSLAFNWQSRFALTIVESFRYTGEKTEAHSWPLKNEILTSDVNNVFVFECVYLKQLFILVEANTAVSIFFSVSSQ